MNTSYLLFLCLLLEDLSDITDHYVTEKETEQYSLEYINDRITELRIEKSKLHSQRDSLLFSDTDKKKRMLEYSTLSENIAEKESLIDQWMDLTSKDIRMDQEIPLLMQKYTDEKDKLTAHWSQTEDFMEKRDLDLLISGSVEKLGDLFFLSVFCYSKYMEDPVIEFQKAGSEEELNSILMEVSDTLRSVILGRSWSELSITATPDNALIVIDGNTMGVGSFHSKTMTPGFITYTVKSSGFRTYSSQIYLAPEYGDSRSVELEQGASENLFINSVPPEADVYFGALWIGKTPLETHKPFELEQLKIAKENFMPFIISSDQLESDSITVNLDSNLYDKKKRLQESKSAFYRSLGWFSLSIGVPLILSGIYQNLDNRYYNYAVDYNSTANPDSYDKALFYKKYADISYYSFWGGVTVSGALFVNTLFKLRNYIIAAEESTEE